jgi:hypothetical protein
MSHPGLPASAELILSPSAALVSAWARLILPHYGRAGSMDADLEEFPEAEGPSYYNQFAHWPLLLLSEGILGGVPEAEEQELLRACALRNLEYLLRITGSDFMTPHYSKGRDWGRHVGEWSNYFLLRSLDVLESRRLGSADLRERLARSLRGASGRIYADLAKAYGAPNHCCAAFPGNHAVWHALLCYEAGVRFGETAWVALAQDFFRRQVLPFQDSTGCWPEGGGMVVNYAMVTAQAVSVYAEAAGDAGALAALGRYLPFARLFSFPDGSSSVAADCRMRYSPRPMVFLPPSFLRTPEGRAECLRRVSGFARLLPGTPAGKIGAQGLAFFALLPAFLAARRESLPEGLPEHSLSGIPAARLEAGPWTAFLSWQLTAETTNRFVLDAQNFVELHHATSGYLVGGGNSKYMPRFSTLRRKTSGRPYLPDSAVVLAQTADTATAAYAFGEDRIEVRLALAAEHAEIGFRLASCRRPAEQYEGALMLRLEAGDVVRLDEVETTVTPTGHIERYFGASGGRLQWRGRTFHLPPGTQVNYPVTPHNPYRQDGLAPVEEYVARLAVPLSASEQVVRLG